MLAWCCEADSRHGFPFRRLELLLSSHLLRWGGAMSKLVVMSVSGWRPESLALSAPS